MERKIAVLLVFIIICLLLQKIFISLNPKINILFAAVIAVSFINPSLKVFFVAGLSIAADLIFGTQGYHLLILSFIAFVASLASYYLVLSNKLSLIFSIVVNLIIAWLASYLFNLIFRGLIAGFFSLSPFVLNANFWLYYLLFNSLLIYLAISWGRKLSKNQSNP